MSDYSLETYADILRTVREAGYEFAQFVGEGEGKRLYLRHDVDFSPEMAVRLAKVNHAQAVTATFFVLLRSPVYNVLSNVVRQHFGALRNLGQRIGLHVEVGGIDTSEKDAVLSLVRRDYDALANELGEIDPVFAFHTLSPDVGDRLHALSVDGFVQAAPHFAQLYISDSNMAKSIAEIRAAVESGSETMQLLLHPFYWVAGGATALQALARTWPSLIRANDAELRRNASYARAFPSGLPPEVLEAFVTGVLSEGGA